MRVLHTESRASERDEAVVAGRSLLARVVERTRILLRSADGLSNKEIAREMGVPHEKAGAQSSY